VNGGPVVEGHALAQREAALVLPTARHDSASAGTNFESLRMSTSGSTTERRTDVPEIE